jgi:hypothetical protein
MLANSSQVIKLFQNGKWSIGVQTSGKVSQNIILINVDSYSILYLALFYVFKKDGIAWGFSILEIEY